MLRFRLLAALVAAALIATITPSAAEASRSDHYRESEVDFGNCLELSTGTTVALAELEDRVPDSVPVLSLTDQGFVFPGSDELGTLVIRTLECDSITVTRNGQTRTQRNRHIAHIGTPVATSALPDTPFSTDGGNGADFNNYILAYYSDSWIYRGAMRDAGLQGYGTARIDIDDTVVGDCLVDRTVTVEPVRFFANFGFTATGIVPDARCETPDVPFVANWWSVNNGHASVLSNNVAGQAAIFIDPAETVISIEAGRRSELHDMFGADAATADAYAVLGNIPETDGLDMVMTPAGPVAHRPVVASTSVRESGMTVTVQPAGETVVHTLTAPEQVFANSTHIIETENSLVVIDTQFLLPNAADFRSYADELGKPIDRVFITHEHPDHFLGSEAFADVPVYALEEVSLAIAANGAAEVAEKQGDFGPEAIASTFVIPEVVEPGLIHIDGVAFELSEVLDAEAEVQLVIRVPEAGAIVTGDLVYSGVHLILAGPADTWTVALEGLAADSASYPIVLAGHGVPADPSVYAANIAWLAKATELMGTVDNAEDFKQGLVDAFPELGMAAAIDFVTPFLFPEG